MKGMISLFHYMMGMNRLGRGRGEGVGTRAGLSSKSKGDFTGKLLQYQIYSSLLSRRTLSLISMPDHIFQLILMESLIQPMGI